MNSPEGWTTPKVIDVITHHASGPSPTCEERNVASSEEWGLLKTTAVVWDGWNSRAHKVPPRQYWGQTRLEVHSGDVLVTKAGPRDRCGVTVYVDESPPRLMVSGKMILLRPNPEYVNHVVLASALATEKCQRYLDCRTTGLADAQLNFTNELLLGAELELPPKPEQNKIARILTSLDNLIEKTEALIAKYQAIKQGMMHDLFTRGIASSGQLRPTHAQAPDLYKPSELGPIPKEWNSGIVENVLSGRPKNGYSPQEGEVWTGTMMLGLGCLTRNGFSPVQLKYAPPNDPKLKQALLSDGDVLMSRSNTTDLVGLVGSYKDIGVPCIYSDLMMRLVPNHEVSGAFLEQLLMFDPVRRQLTNAACGTSGSMKKINSTMVLNTKVVWAQEYEQEEILRRLEPINGTIRQEQMHLNKLRQQKSGLMQDLLTGKVRVRLNENEEPSNG